MEVIGMVYGAIAFAICGFSIGCTCTAKCLKNEITKTENEIEYNIKDIG